MKVIIAGSRTIRKPEIVVAAIEASGFAPQITQVVSGGAGGPDTYGEQWAHARGLPIKRFLAEWHRYGKRAGPLRNREMAAYSEALIAVHDGKSRGTANMIEEATKRGLKVFVREVPL